MGYTATQLGYAAMIVAVGRRMGVAVRGIKIGLAAGLVETNLQNFANRAVPGSMSVPHDAVGSDGRSVGILQQQPQWWGRGDGIDLMNPATAAALFFERLVKLDYLGPGSPGSYAQAVQRSAYPARYDERFAEASALYDQIAATVSSGVIVPSDQEVAPVGDPVWLPDVLRAAGLRCDIYPGAYERGHGDFGQIWGVVCHHTGSFGETPHGIAEHPDLGLASQLYLSRDGVFTLCGVGIAWHAGNGSWPGIPTDNANQCTIGIEAANDGGGTPGRPHRSSWPAAQYESYVTGVAAILNHLGQPASHAIGHKEWAGAAQGKWDPGAIDMNIFRADVTREQARLKGNGGFLMALTDAEQKELLTKTRVIYDQLGPNLWGPESSMGKTADGKELTLRDGLANFKRFVESKLGGK